MTWLSNEDREWFKQFESNESSASGKYKEVQVMANGNYNWLTLPYEMWTSDIQDWVLKQGHNKITCLKNSKGYTTNYSWSRGY